LFVVFVIVCIALGWCGGKNPGLIMAKTADFSATLTWVEGGQVIEQPVQAAEANDWDEAASAARAALTQQGASMTAVSREAAATGRARGVVGGTERSETVSGETVDEMEAAIGELKTRVGQAAPFFVVERRLPPTFTVTNFSQILTAYYFLFFLIFLPILGLSERPGRVPDTIAKPVTANETAGAA
jgi:ubiquinol-cytochrome c reductase cytochrome b subunit